MHQLNPCLECGACCAYFRVSFYWGESDPEQGGQVPPELTEPVSSFRSCMKGTNTARPRCAALRGEVGRTTFCAIYDRRPSPCRQFGPGQEFNSFEEYQAALERCSLTRRAFGLPPADAAWSKPQPLEPDLFTC